MSDNIEIEVQRDLIIPSHELDDNATTSAPMTRGQAIRDFLFGVFLPTIDVGSDLLFAFRLLLADWSFCSDPSMSRYRFTFAGVSFIFPSISFLFVTY